MQIDFSGRNQPIFLASSLGSRYYEAVLASTTTMRIDMKTTAVGKYFVYARKSTDSEDRQVRSIPDQLAEMRDLAARLHIDIVDIFTESQSAKEPGRPVFNDMLN